MYIWTKKDNAPQITGYVMLFRISYLEIYNETMFDLLSTLPETMTAAQQNSMTVVEDEHGVYVKGLSCHLAQSEEEALNLLFEVNKYVFKTHQ